MSRTVPDIRVVRRRLAAFAVVVALSALSGCGGGGATRSTETVAQATQPPTTAPGSDRGHRGGSGPGGGGGARTVPTLPAGWPTDVPAPPGVIQGSTHGTVLALAPGSAQTVMLQTVERYRSAGFVAETDAILHNALHRVTINVENRDHSASQTFVLVAVSER